MWDSSCNQQTKSDNVTPLWDLVSITGVGNAGWTHPLAALRPSTIGADCSSGLAMIDPSGTHLLFTYQASAFCAANYNPGGGFSFYLGGCALPCSSTSYASMANPVNWPTLTAGDNVGAESCQSKYSGGCPMVGVLDPVFLTNTDGTTDINHALLTVMEVGGTANYWSINFININWTGAAPSITKVSRWVPPSASAWTTQFGSLATCSHYMKADGAKGITFSSGVPTGGTVFLHADLNPYSSDFTKCATRGADPTESGLYRFDIGNAPYGNNFTAIGPLQTTGQQVFSSSTGRSCSTTGTCDVNRYAEFPTYLADANKILFGAVLTTPVTGSDQLNGNMHMELFVANPDGSSPAQLTNLNNFGSPMFKAFSLCGYSGIAKPYYNQTAQSVITAVATCQAGPNGYSNSINKIVLWPLTGSPVYQ